MTNNSLSEDIYAVGELMAENLNTKGVVSADPDDGLTTLAEKILDIDASGTLLTIEVPLNLIYSDDFNITGTLLDGNNSPINGATVKLKVGSTVVDSETTDSDGEVSFTRTPVSMGNHSFQLVFEGDSTHPPANSSVVTREIGKETSAITVVSPAAISSYYNDTNIYISGTLKTDDNESIAGAAVLVKLGSTQLASLTTANDGSFTGSISAGDLNIGSNTLKFEFEGDSFYSTSYQEVGITVNQASLGLSANKNILSYADSDSCVLTATYTGSTVAGHTVKLYDASDDSLVATMVDNGDGTYSTTYVSQGVGDIGFYAVSGNFVTETFVVEDCWAYHTTVTDSDSHFTKYTWGSNWYYLSNYEVSTGFKVIMKFSTNITNCQVGLGSSSGNYFAIQPVNSKINVYVSTSSQTNVNFPTSANEIIYELVDSQTAKLYVDNTLVGTYTPNSNINRYIKAVIYQGAVYDMEYVKIKPL